MTPLALTAIAVLLLIGIAGAGLHFTYGVFDADELQHAHIAWLIARGEVPYRDFWEHHGPLFGLVNGWLLRISGAPPGIDLLYACRAHSTMASMAALLATYLIARAAGLARTASAAAPAILLASFFVHDKGVECRPDTWQNAFWLMGLWVLLRSLRRRQPVMTTLAGSLMGLAALTNAKAGLGPLAILLFYLFGARLHGLGARAVAADLGLLATGGLLPYALVLLYFLAHDAIPDFHYYNLAWNFAAAGYEVEATDRGWRFAASFVQRQWPIALAAAAGLAFWWAGWRRKAWRPETPLIGLIAVSAILSTAGLAAGFYSQYFLFLLPPWCVLAAYGMNSAVERLAPRLGANASIGFAAGAVLGIAPIALQAARFAPTQEQALLQRQKSLTAYLLEVTPRTEPIGVIWDACGGFMFNARLQFYWAADGPVGAVVARQTGENPFGSAFVAALDQARVRYIAGTDGAKFRELPAATQAYIHENFTYTDCLWTRRQPLPVR